MPVHTKATDSTAMVGPVRSNSNALLALSNSPVPTALPVPSCSTALPVRPGTMESVAKPLRL